MIFYAIIILAVLLIPTIIYGWMGFIRHVIESAKKFKGKRDAKKRKEKFEEEKNRRIENRINRKKKR